MFPHTFLFGKIKPKRARKSLIGDSVFKNLTAIFALSVLVLALAIFYELYSRSQLSINEFGLDFLTGVEWDPVDQIFGALPFIYGTVTSSIIALIIAVPISLGIATYLSELAPKRLRSPLSFMVELLAAVPSVVYGLWGLFVMVPWIRDVLQPFLESTLGFLPFFQGPKFGIGMLSGGVILAIMIIPTISAVSREVMLAVPDTQREAAFALGATRWETIKTAVLRYAATGIFGAIMLGLGRALGETMAVIMVIGNRPQISLSFFEPAYTMSGVIASEYIEATQDLYLSSLIEIGLLLFIVTLMMNIIARLLVWRTMRKFRGAKE
ncbi:MAG: phosphate ABC transporter permease subunit PstC [Nitrososphaerales archaeon]|nr:phosphate ABC transporter permease subunit PstC [Nitrososphaerales archaeon]